MRPGKITSKRYPLHSNAVTMELSEVPAAAWCTNQWGRMVSCGRLAIGPSNFRMRFSFRRAMPQGDAPQK